MSTNSKPFNPGHPPILNGQKIAVPDQYNMLVKVDPVKHPCQYDCAVKHEMVHARMCAALGGTKFNALSEAQKEVPAYTVELGCYLQLQLDNKLGPYK
jgi:hypothetical protein